MAKVFLSYAREDRNEAEEIYKKLVVAGFVPFMDVKDILPGEDWSSRIQQAIKESDFFLAVLSRHSVNKRGYLQKEFKLGIDTWELMLDYDIYLIPIRLDNCLVPDRLSKFQWVDLFTADGFDNLLSALKTGLQRRGLKVHKPSSYHKKDVATRASSAPVTIDYPISLEMVNVPLGYFFMGSDPTKDKYAKLDEQPMVEIRIAGFKISRYLITNYQYQVFITDTKNDPPIFWENDRIPAGKNNHPVIGISWDDAKRFCDWLAFRTGKKFRLPTEAEWEKSARGVDGGLYPWGNRWCAAKTNSLEAHLNTTTGVGHYSPQSDSPYNLADMAGNVWEWCSTIYQPYPYSEKDGRENLGVHGHRVVRGGSFASNQMEVRSANRDRYDQSFKHGYIGFRVVLDNVNNG